LLISERICLKIIPYQKTFESLMAKTNQLDNIMKDQKDPSDIKQKYFSNGHFLKSYGASPSFGASSEINKSNKQLEDLPDEVILYVMDFLELTDLVRCGLVSKRIRSVSFIESLWQKVDISTSGNSRKIVPTYFVKTIINRGCKHLSLTGCKVMGNLNYSDFSLDSNYWSSDQKEKYKKIVNQIKIAKNL
jgi:hypothetical protein